MFNYFIRKEKVHRIGTRNINTVPLILKSNPQPLGYYDSCNYTESKLYSFSVRRTMLKIVLF